jgi:hypothetical protein
MNHPNSPFDDYFNAEKKFKCTACGGRLSPSFVQWPRDSNRAAHPSPTLCNKCCPRITIEVVFLTRSGAASAIDALLAAGYDVLVGDHLADPQSAETVFIEVYGRFNRGDADIEARALAAGAVLTPAMDAFWRDVERIVEPFGGGADICGLIDDDDVPFSNFR